jgi:hypothetical protein
MPTNPGPPVRTYKGVTIFPKNYCGMYSAIVPVSGGGQSVAADTLTGMKELIRHYLNEEN